MFAAALLVLPAKAPAAVTCDYSSGGKLLTVTLNAGGDNAQLAVVAGEITVKSGFTPLTCTGPGGPPLVTNTGVISVTGNVFGGTVVVHGADDFVPGPDPQDGSDPPGSSKEIEIFVNLFSSTGSSLIVDPGDDGGNMVFGRDGINPNVSGEGAPADADIDHNDTVESVSGFGGAGPDALNAQGGLGTGLALTEGISFDGKESSDSVSGGEGPDSIDGGGGNDLQLLGNGGNDMIRPGAGDDSAAGGPGNDTAVLVPAGPARVDLAITGPQDTGEGTDSFASFENAQSGPGGPATLRGDDGPNTLTADFFDDTLVGRGGVDILLAREGADTLDVRDGGPDVASCGPGTDTVIADLPGVDNLVDCENVQFATAPGPGGPPANPGLPISPALPPNAAPSLTALGVTPAAFTTFLGRGGSVAAGLRRRTRGSRVRYRLSEAARTTFAVERARPGRRSGRRCVRPTRRNRATRRCTRFVRQRGSFTHAGRAGANSLRFTGRLNRGRLAIGSYRLVAQARDSAGLSSRVVRRAFRIVR